jgi:8-oxo-dGTP pyrophosphatase MutT (NUDIX family)
MAFQFLGGSIETGQSAVRAAARELVEEAGLVALDAEIIATSANELRL